MRLSSSKTDFGFQEVDKQDKERMVKDVFSSVAAKYDVMNDFMSMGIHRLWKDEFVSMMGLRAAANVDPNRVPRLLDVAGGTGTCIMHLIAPHCTSLHYPNTLQVTSRSAPRRRWCRPSTTRCCRAS